MFEYFSVFLIEFVGTFWVENLFRNILPNLPCGRTAETQLGAVFTPSEYSGGQNKHKAN